MVYTDCIHFVILEKNQKYHRKKKISIFTLFYEQVFVEYLYCAKHCSGTWDMSINKKIT